MSHKLTIEEMQQIALERGGSCLSTDYINNNIKLTWRCASGHVWEATPNSIKNHKRWCPSCAGNLRLTIDDMCSVAKDRGGKCLSNRYINSQTKLLWECGSGHQWMAKPCDIINSKTWCPKCSKKEKSTLQDMIKLAKEMRGKCLSQAYINNRTKLSWLCAEGHEFLMTPTHVKSGHWCPKCAGVRKLSIKEMQLLAEKRGGKCLSEQYVNNKSKLLWECSEGHQWEAVPNSILSGRWCSECSVGLGERICRAFFEQLFKEKFPRTRPPWLRNKKGNLMELDGYCEKLALAFEHHGTQHYQMQDVFSMGLEELESRKREDEYKESICKENGVRLIVVPEIPSMLPVEKVRDFIQRECKCKNIIIPRDFDSVDVDLNVVYRMPFSRERFKQLCMLALSKGGKCLSKGYISMQTKMEWQCANEHRWSTVPGSILKGLWCPHCSGIARGNIYKCKDTAKERGGECLSAEYINNTKLMKWRCSKGHVWKTSWKVIKRGSWCPECGKNRDYRKLTIGEMQDIATQREGLCLSQKYTNSNTNLTWKCKFNHIWKATPSRIKKGAWCPYCAGVAKGSIVRCKELAVKRGGKCLSTHYVNNKSKLLWECSKGHTWEARPNDIQSGYWCPKCGVGARVAKQRLTIDEMRTIAKIRGGHCLSTSYKNRRTKLLWECSEGHRWRASPANVKVLGSWCPICAKNKRKRLKQKGERKKLHN